MPGSQAIGTDMQRTFPTLYPRHVAAAIGTLPPQYKSPWPSVVLRFLRVEKRPSKPHGRKTRSFGLQTVPMARARHHGRTLPPTPDRRTLFNIGADPFHPVFAGVWTDPLVQPQRRRHRQAVGADGGLLHPPQRHRRVDADRLSHPHRLAQSLTAWHDAVDQAPAAGVPGTDIFAEIEHLERDPRRDHPRQHDIGEMRALTALRLRQPEL